MKNVKVKCGSYLIILSCLLAISCDQKQDTIPIIEVVQEETYLLPDIDLSHWKVTLPIGNPTEVTPPEIMEYATNPILKSFMFNDSLDGSMVFYTYPGATTTNSSYSRTELREQMVPGSNNTNWTFAQGGRIRGMLKMDEISKANDGKFHRTIVMQIHGRLTNEQRDLIGKSDNNAPPILKIYWEQGKVKVATKTLKNLDATYKEMLQEDAWGDRSVSFRKAVDFNKFVLEVIASESRLEVILDEEEKIIFEDIHMQKWGIFENYFKAGNYLQSKDSGSYAKVKYFDLVVEH